MTTEGGAFNIFLQLWNCIEIHNDKRQLSIFFSLSLMASLCISAILFYFFFFALLWHKCLQNSYLDKRRIALRRLVPKVYFGCKTLRRGKACHRNYEPATHKWRGLPYKDEIRIIWKVFFHFSYALGQEQSHFSVAALPANNLQSLGSILLEKLA